MNATTFAGRYIADQNADAPVAVTTWAYKTMSKRQLRECPVREVIDALQHMAAEGEVVQVESVMGALAFIAAPEPAVEAEAEVVTHADAVKLLTAEGHDEADVVAALDSMVDAGLEVESDDDGTAYLTAGELAMVREELAAVEKFRIHMGPDELDGDRVSLEKREDGTWVEVDHELLEASEESAPYDAAVEKLLGVHGLRPASVPVETSF